MLRETSILHHHLANTRIVSLLFCTAFFACTFPVAPTFGEAAAAVIGVTLAWALAPCLCFYQQSSSRIQIEFGQHPTPPPTLRAIRRPRPRGEPPSSSASSLELRRDATGPHRKPSWSRLFPAQEKYGELRREPHLAGGRLPRSNRRRVRLRVHLSVRSLQQVAPGSPGWARGRRAELLEQSSLHAGMASRISFTSFIVVRDTRTDGFITYVLPPVMATGAIQRGIMAERLQGAMPPQTPRGWRMEQQSTSVATPSLNTSNVKRGHVGTVLGHLRPRTTSSLASAMALLCSCVLISARVSVLSQTSRAKCNFRR